MNMLQGLILGVVQGLTEFLPVSSSGHLVLFSKLPFWSGQPLVFDTTLHLATAATLVIYFYKDLIQILLAFIADFKKYALKISTYSENGKTLLYLLLGSFPAGILGLLFETSFESIFRSVISVAVFLILGSVLMYSAQVYNTKSKTAGEVTYLKSFYIGIFQALALFPGISRSGSTISGGLFMGLDRYRAARFSFLLSIPIVVVAGLFKLFSTDWAVIDVSTSVLLVGFMSSFLSGLAVVHFLLSYLKNRNLDIFIYYRLILALGLVIIHFL